MDGTANSIDRSAIPSSFTTHNHHRCTPLPPSVPPSARPPLATRRSMDASQTLKIAGALQNSINFYFSRPQAEPDMDNPGLPAP